MAEILGLGLTHYPSLIAPDENKTWPLPRLIASHPGVPEEMKIPTNWPEPMRIEYGEDEGVASARKHRGRLVSSVRQIRKELDDFDPDFIVLWGDDQYENFKEDIIPPFCVLAYDEIHCQPLTLRDGNPRPNVWDEPGDKVFSYAGHTEAARYLTGKLIEQSIDMSYSYRPLHEPGLGHAFINTLLYLDYDRRGFDYPVVPCAINCYGSRVVRNHGSLFPQKVNGVDLPADPPGPSPKRCMELGAATVHALADSPWRVALVASSSWSHGFLTEKNHWLWPDHESDRQRMEELAAGDYDAWRDVSIATIEDAGQQELLNWMCLAGAMEELDRKPEIVDYVETWIFNSNKCMAIFRP